MATIIYLTEIIQEEDGQFVSYCPELDVASCGESIDEAYSNIQEAIALHLNVLEELGLRQRVFNERGIEVHRDKPAKEPVLHGDLGLRRTSCHLIPVT
jgi:predicted RNase H-like HicB family nuclease